MKGYFGPDMTSEEKRQVKQLLRSKGITIVAMGVIGPPGAWTNGKNTSHSVRNSD